MRRLLGLAVLILAGCKRPDPAEVGQRVLHMAVRTRLSSLDPVRCQSQYDSQLVGALFEPLLEYEYLVRPYRLVPAALARMPEVSADLLSYSFELRDDLFFHDDPAFPDGRGRAATAADVVYSIKRMANSELRPTGWWIYAGRIRGLDAYRQAQEARPPGTPFDYDAPVEGLEVVDRLRFRLHLTRPFPQILNVLAMCYASVVPREAAERYGLGFSAHPVGSGPFRVRELSLASRVRLERHPRYRAARFPHEGTEEDRARGLLADAGAPVPALDGVVVQVFEQDPPLWLKWRVGDLDFIMVPAEYQPVAFDESGALRPQLAAQGVTAFRQQKLDFIYRGFNMEDPLLGGFARGKKLRQAIALALDMGEIGDAFYANTVVEYDGPIPPGLEGHPAGRISPYRGPDLARARALLAEAGFPEGQGLPPIRYHINNSGSSPAMADMTVRQLARVGVRLEVQAHSTAQLEDMMRKKQAQMFVYSWNSDYPDAENNLALFYGPNSSPGANFFNYRREEYDRLYEEAQVMPSSPARTALYQRMRDLIIEDCPAVGSMARTRYYVANPRLRRFKPDEMWYGWLKYLDVIPR